MKARPRGAAAPAVTQGTATFTERTTLSQLGEHPVAFCRFAHHASTKRRSS